MYSLWEDIDVEWTSKYAADRSEGMLIVCKKGRFDLYFRFSGVGFVGVNDRWKWVNLFLINVYSSYESRAKRFRWKEVRDYKSKFLAGEWCIYGDFNAIKNNLERKSENFMVNRSEILDFCEFIDGMKVIDIPSVGSKFNWFNVEGLAMTRLNRFLLL